MGKRKDASQAPGKATGAAPTRARPPPRVAPPARTADAPKPSKFRFATLLFRIASLAFALYTLYRRMYPPASPVDLDLDDRNRVRHTHIEKDQSRQAAVLDAFKASLLQPPYRRRVPARSPQR